MLVTDVTSGMLDTKLVTVLAALVTNIPYILTQTLKNGHQHKVINIHLSRIKQ